MNRSISGAKFDGSIVMCVLCLFIASTLTNATFADDEQTWGAHYLANAGVMVARGDTKILFDPFFRNGFGQYDLLPPAMEASLFAGTPPWDGVDAIFISHHHGDHFDPEVIMNFLTTWPAVELYAPRQAVAGLLALQDSPSESLLARIHSITLERNSDAARLEMQGLLVEAVRVAHGGWPHRHADVENLVFRVTLDDSTTVMHMGDADGGKQHYEPHREFWQARTTHLALAPVWLFLTAKGQYVLDEHVNAEHAIGIHVFDSVANEPKDRPPEFEGLDIFTQPGESRQWP